MGGSASTAPARPGRSSEGLIVAHHASRQDLRHAAVCCDVETRERGGCEGWDMFDDETLAKELQALVGRPVRIR